jgi:hypothetical protein
MHSSSMRCKACTRLLFSTQPQLADFGLVKILKEDYIYNR